MNKKIFIWKSIGLTPLEVIHKFKEHNPKYKNEIISYAGRLDPMAQGVLMLLIGNENKNRNDYLSLNKEYETEIIFGISTDSFDSLGLISNVTFKEILISEIEQKLKLFKGKQTQLYPPFSSKTVDGKPLFWWAKNGKIEEIEIPNREIEIYKIELLESEDINLSQMVEEILSQIKKVNGDFRQREIENTWIELKQKYSIKNLVKIKIKVNCSTGTYIRRLADDLGKKVGNLAFAYSIKRTKIGDISEKDCLKIN